MMEPAKARYNQRLQERLSSRVDPLFRERLSFVDEDLVPLDLLTNDDADRALCKGRQHERQEEERGRQAVPVSLSDLIERHQCGDGLSFILGPPGAGKSTLMRQLAMRLAEVGEEVPVLVTADLLGRALAPTPPQSREAALAVLVRGMDGSLREGGETARDLRRVSVEGGLPLTLLVDGLDEVADRDAILRGVADMQDLLLDDDVAPPLFRRVIISSRPGAFEALPVHATAVQAAKVLRVQPLDAQMSAELVRRLLGKWEGVGGEVVERAVEVGGSVFAGSPLLLYLLCGLARKARVVPKDVVSLYDGIIKLLLERGSKRPGDGGEVPDTDRTLQLCRLVAYVVHSLGQSAQSLVVEREGMRAVLREVVEGIGEGKWAGELFPGRTTTASLLDQVLEGFGGLLSQERDWEEGRGGYVLLHRTLQEYLAASFLTPDEHSKRPQWARVRDFVVGGVSGREGAAAVQLLPAFEFGDERLICSDWWAEVYRFAGLRQGPRWLGERMLLGEPGFREWLAGIRKHGLDRRDLAYCRLRHVVRACCRGGQGGGEVEAVGVTLATLLRGERYDLAIGKVLTRVPESEWQACEACDVGVVEAAVGLLAENKTPSALWALGGGAVSSHPGAMQALVKLLEDGEGGVRSSAARALGWLGAAAVASHPGAMEALVKLLGDRAWEVQISTAEAVSRLGAAAVASHPGAMQALVKLLEDGEGGVRSSAANAVGKLGAAAVASHPGAMEGLVKLLEDEDMWVRSSAARALGRLGAAAAVSSHPGAMEGLVKLVEDEDMWVRSSAADALAMLGAAAVSSRPGAVEARVKLLGDRAWEVQSSAAASVSRLGSDGLCCLSLSAAKAAGQPLPLPMQPVGDASELDAINNFEHVGPLMGSGDGENHDGMEVVRRRQQGGGGGAVYVRKWTADYEMFDKEVTRLEHIKGDGLEDGERAMFCELVAWGTAADEWVLVMDYCEGGSMERLLVRRPSEDELPLTTVLRWAEGMARALDVMHRRLGRLHLDFSPGNLLLTQADLGKAGIKLADFGTSQVCRGGEWDEGSVADVEYSMASELMSAPEQGTERFVSPATDRYQLGLVLLQLLCRRRLEDMESDAMVRLRDGRQLMVNEIAVRGLGRRSFSELPVYVREQWKPVGPAEAEAEMDRLPSKGQPLRQLVLDLLRPEAPDRPSGIDVIRRIRAAM